MDRPLPKITGAEYARRLLGIDAPGHPIDHLLKKLAPPNRNQVGWESNLLELKATYYPSPKFPNDPDKGQPDIFAWNVVHAFLALANAQGGCVVIGIDEKKRTKALRKGDWDPNQVLTQHGKHIKTQRTGKEWEQLEEDVRKCLFGGNVNQGAKTFSFAVKTRKHHDAPLVPHVFAIDEPTMRRLADLVSFHNCHSDMCKCGAIAAIVSPIEKGALCSK